MADTVDMRTASTQASRAALHPMSRADVPAVIAQQHACLRGSIVTELGDRFLTRFHAAALEHPATRAFVAREQELIGFAIGTIDVHAFNRFVKPRVLPALVRALLSPRGLMLAPRFVGSIVERKPQPHIPAELLLLAVDERARRQGVGRRLLAALEEDFARDGVAVYRVAVRTRLDDARRFYRAVGFDAEQQMLVLGEPMTYLTKRLQP